MTAAFAFGKNWLDFIDRASETQFREAEKRIARLAGCSSLTGKSFVDVGCGSGMFSLAAKRLGATVRSFDIDPDSVACAAKLGISATIGDILDNEFIGKLGTYDFVYSWGVLHHTGNLWKAIANARLLLKPNGKLIIALYRRTKLCWLWKIEKRLYSASPSFVQLPVRAAYKAVFCLGLLMTSRNPRSYIADYKQACGMDWHTDVHDWLGGYPYTSVDPKQVIRFLEDIGLKLERIYECSPGIGLFGTACDEYVATMV